MRLYLAGPLFTDAERAWLDRAADVLELAGHECFVPHRVAFASLDPDTIYAADSDALRAADAVVAWLDGPMIDDGTACEIGMFAELRRHDPTKRGIVGIVTDWRVHRHAASADGGLNMFVHGAVRANGTIVDSIEAAAEVLGGWAVA